MHIPDLADKLAAKSLDTTTKKGAKEAVDYIVGEMAAALVRGEEVNLNNFGKLVPKKTNARMGRNPKTGESIPVPAGTRIAFKISSVLKGKL